MKDKLRFFVATGLGLICGNLTFFTLPEPVAASCMPSSDGSQMYCSPDTYLKLVLDANNGTGNLYLYPEADSANSNHLWRLNRLSNGKIYK